ncbi:hypothetical protein, partial [Paraclostridium bifermentans]
MKKTNKKILKFITLIILLISTAICGSSLQELRFGDTYQYTKPSNLVSKSNSLYAKNFFESDMFDNSTLQNILHNLTMITSNTQMRSEEEIASAKNTISEFKDIKFFVMNDSTGVSYSNTKYRDNEEFRKNQKGYVNLEIDFSNNMNTYTKIIDNKRSSYRVNRDLFWGVPKDNLTISMSFPKESSNDGYNSILFDGNYSSFEYYKNLSNKLNKVLIASAISSIISLI